MNIKPIDIILVTYKRLDLLQKTVKGIYHRTKYPYRLLVINNDKEDRAVDKWLTYIKSCGYVYDFISLDNKGFAAALTEGFKYFENTKEGVSEYIITTQDDLIPANLRPECWLERLLELFKKYEHEYGAISCRTQRIRRREVEEERELIDSPTSLSSCFRIQRSDDIKLLGGFGSRPHWESPVISENMKSLNKKVAVATHLYCNDLGFALANKGYPEGFTQYNTYSPERVNQGDLQPFCDIDDETCVPMKVNNPRDMDEHKKRLEFWKLYGFKKSAVMLESLRYRHGRKKYEFIQMNEFVHFLYTMARDYDKVGTIVEIGTANGVSTNAFLYGLHDRHKSPNQRKLYSIDINKECINKADVDIDVKYLWEFVNADSTKMKWDKGQIDILLIDGDHSYEAVKADYDNFAPFVRKGGLILLHDVSWLQKGVKKFYEELGTPGVILPLSPSGMAVFQKI